MQGQCAQDQIEASRAERQRLLVGHHRELAAAPRHGLRQIGLDHLFETVILQLGSELPGMAAEVECRSKRAFEIGEPVDQPGSDVTDQEVVRRERRTLPSRDAREPPPGRRREPDRSSRSHLRSCQQR